MTTYPLPTLSAQIDSTGISAPPFEDILLSLQASYRLIYGSAIDLDPDTQDGQFLAVIATAINDNNNAMIATYNAYSPSTAQGAGLSSVVKINAIRREPSSASTCPVRVVGPNGTTIRNGLVGDNQGLNTQWALPATVNIGPSGYVDVTATCTQDGAIQAASGTLTQILTPSAGWQSVTNLFDASPGNPIEDDATLRQRQTISTSKPAFTPLSSIRSSVANVTGVSHSKVYENSQDITDGNGIPSHSISAVVEGGTDQDIIDAIGSKKTPGTGTYGTTSGIFVDPSGVDQPINFFRLALDRIIVTVNLTHLDGWATTTVPVIQQAVADYINSLAIGENVYLFRVASAAGLYNDALSETFNITGLTQAVFGNPEIPADIITAFNHTATCDPSDVTVNVT